MEESALGGVTVLEYCQMVAGPFCSRLLADYGARVIKIEHPRTGDPARHVGPFAQDRLGQDHSLPFLYLNVNKESITLDLHTSTGADLFRQMVAKADVFIEDTTPGTLQAQAMGYPSLQNVNPQLIMTSITPFGQTGPYRRFKSYTLNSFNAGGGAYLLPGGSQYLDRPPVRGADYMGDYDCGISAALATLAVLLTRHLYGTGQHIDVSEQETLLFLNKQEISGYANKLSELPSRATQIMPHRAVVPCKDGFVELHLLREENQWRAFVEIMGSPEWAQDERFKDPQGRASNKEALVQAIARWAMQHTKQEIARLGQARGLSVAPYNSPKEVLESEQYKARQFFQEIIHPELGSFSMPTNPYRFTEMSWTHRRPAPRLGEHNPQVFSEMLGLDNDELRALRERGII